MRTRLVVGAIALAAVGGATSAAPEGRLAELAGFRSFGGAERGIVSPIAGDAVTIEEARARASYAIPLLPEASMSEVCDEGSIRLHLLQAWSNHRGTDPEFHQTALTYNHGAYLQLEPVTAYRFGIVPELPPVEDAFSPDDYPEGLSTSTVRGHVAWVNELEAPVTCPERPDLTISYTPGPECPNGMCTTGPPPQAPGAFMFSPTETAVVKWLERGVVMDIVGPYPSEILKALAEGMRWPDQEPASP